jgi:ABC-2 type transport system permease protein
MNALVVSIRKEMLEQWRTYRAVIVAVVLVAFGMLSPLTAKFTPEIIKLVAGGDDVMAQQLAAAIPKPTVNDAVAQYVKNTSQFGLILALLVTMGVVAQEKERGTAALMLVKPLPRWAFLAAKFAGLALTFALSLALAGLAAYYYTWFLFEPLKLGPFLALNGLLLLYVLVYVALTLLCSALTRSQTAAGGLAFGLMILLSIPSAVPQIAQYLPGQLAGWGAALAVGAPGVEPAWPAFWLSVGLIAASLAGAWLVFDRQEL